MKTGYLIRATNNHRTYQFESIGPKGVIKKIIKYTRLREWNENIYNLSFGDWDEFKQEINFNANTNNGDRKKVLITVALTIIEFSNNHPDSIIHIKGSTPSRTRLYQIEMTIYFGKINGLFNIYGYRKGAWEPFKPNCNYEAFAVMSK